MTFVHVCVVVHEPGGIWEAASWDFITGVGPLTHKHPVLLQVCGVEQLRPAIIGLMPGQHSAVKTIGGPAEAVIPASEEDSYFAGNNFRHARICRMFHAYTTETRNND